MGLLGKVRRTFVESGVTVRILIFAAVVVAGANVALSYLQELPLADVMTFILVLMAATLLLFFIYLRNVFVKPVKEVIAAAEKITDGQLDQRINTARRDEIGQLAVSINRATETMQQRLQQLATLCDISRESAATMSLSKVLHLILDNAVRMQGADSGSIMLLDERTGLMSIRASKNLDPEVVRKTTIKVGEGISGWVAKERKPLLLVDGIDDPRFKGTREVNDAVSIPIVLNGRVVGVMNLSNDKPGAKVRYLDGKGFTENDLDFLLTLANQAASAIHNAQLFEDLRANYFSTIQALAAAIDAKDPYTHGHSARVAQYALMVVERIRDISTVDRETIQAAAYLHDIGKIGIPEPILTKPGKLTDDEYEIIKTHPEISARILAPVHFRGEVISIVRHHHERIDGNGYPDHLSGNDIPLEARLLAVADSFDAMTSIRPYRPPLTMEQAKAELCRCSGSQFDGDIVKLFVAAVDEAAEAALSGSARPTF